MENSNSFVDGSILFVGPNFAFSSSVFIKFYSFFIFSSRLRLRLNLIPKLNDDHPCHFYR